MFVDGTDDYEDRYGESESDERHCFVANATTTAVHIHAAERERNELCKSGDIKMVLLIDQEGGRWW